MSNIRGTENLHNFFPQMDNHHLPWYDINVRPITTKSRIMENETKTKDLLGTHRLEGAQELFESLKELREKALGLVMTPIEAVVTIKRNPFASSFIPADENPFSGSMGKALPHSMEVVLSKLRKVEHTNWFVSTMQKYGIFKGTAVRSGLMISLLKPEKIEMISQDEDIYAITLRGRIVSVFKVERKTLDLGRKLTRKEAKQYRRKLKMYQERIKHKRKIVKL